MQNWKIFIEELWNNLTPNRRRLIISCDWTCLKIHLPIPILRKNTASETFMFNWRNIWTPFFFYNGIKHLHIRWKN